MATCECSDNHCPIHEGKSQCQYVGRQYLQRIDMIDHTGTLFCDKCSNDAMESGLFTPMHHMQARKMRGL